MKSENIKNVLAFAFISILLVLSIIFINTFFATILSDRDIDADLEPFPIIVLDAGHGGADGGAVGYDGTLEKDLNLQITKTLADLLRVSGYDVIMTRTEDVMLSTDDGIGSSKMQDLKQRLSISSEHPDTITISIHCNKFPSASCKGLQVYHSDSEKAAALAESVQSSVATILQTGNKRQIKKADSSIYLLHRAKNPSILIECGFLSNPDECASLSDQGYQKQLSAILLCAISSKYPPNSILES